MLLARNDIGAAPAAVGRRNAGLDLPTCDPLSLDYPVPRWPDTPWRLVKFYMEALRQRWGHDGKQWEPPLGGNSRVYLKAAKSLLDNLGTDLAVRSVLYGISIASRPPSLQWIVREVAPQVKEKCQAELWT